MKKRWNIYVRSKRALAVLFAAVLILETAPLQSRAAEYANTGKTACDAAAAQNMPFSADSAAETASNAEKAEYSSETAEQRHKESSSEAAGSEKTESAPAAAESEKTGSSAETVDSEKTQSSSGKAESEKTGSSAETVDSENAESSSEAADAEKTESSPAAAESEKTGSSAETTAFEKEENLSGAAEQKDKESSAAAVDSEKAEKASGESDPQKTENASGASEQKKAENASGASEQKKAENASGASEQKNKDNVSEPSEQKSSENVSEPTEQKKTENASDAKEQNSKKRSVKLKNVKEDGEEADEAGEEGIAPVSLVKEEEAPVISAEISDREHKVIYTCSSSQPPEERPEQTGGYYGTLNVQISVREMPQQDEAKEYSGISEVLWALVPEGTDEETARESSRQLMQNDTPADVDQLYREEKYGTFTGAIDPDELVEALVRRKTGYEKSGCYVLYIRAVDFCGNGEDSPLKIPLFLDVSAPDVTIRAEGGKEYKEQYYYRADSSKNPSDGEDAAVITVRAEDDRKEGGIGSLTAVLKGGASKKPLTRKSPESDRSRIVFTVKDLQEHFGNTEQEIVISVSSSDDAGNTTDRIAEEGSSGVSLTEVRKGYGESASLIRDAKAPEVTITYASADDAGLHVYAGEGGEAGSGPAGGRKEEGFTVYTSGPVKVSFQTQDAFAEKKDLFCDFSGVPGFGGNLECNRVTQRVIDVGEGEEKSFACSAYGSDIAGNPAAVRECFADGAKVRRHPEDLTIADPDEQTGCGQSGDYTSTYDFVLDRKAPLITVTYAMDTEKNPAQTAFLYDDENAAGNVLTAYSSGPVTVTASVNEGEEEYDFGRLYYKNPGQEAAAWNLADIEHEQAGGDGRKAGIWLAPADSDGTYVYHVYGTDRAGNRANVKEQFAAGMRLEKMYSDKKETVGQRKSADAKTAPYYAIIIDTLPPAVSEITTKDLDIDEDGTITERGESDPAYYEDTDAFYYNKDGIRTVMKIEEKNFDRQRITAGWNLNGKSETGIGEVGDKKILLTFRAEGVYENISVYGTDRAGNHLVKEAGDPDSREADEAAQNASEQKTDEAAQNASEQKTEDAAHNASEQKTEDAAHNASGNAAGQKAGETAENAAGRKTGIPSQNALLQCGAQSSREKDSRGPADPHVELAFSRIIDRQSPVAVITHTVPDNTTGYLYPESERGSTAALYCKRAVTTSISISDTLGQGDKAGKALLDGRKLEVKKYFRRSGNSFAASEIGQWKRLPGSTAPLGAQVKTEAEGCCVFTVRGTDRAGNPLIVKESLRADPAKKAVLDQEKGGYDRGAPGSRALEENETYGSFYALVYDKTAPVYSLSVNDPPDPEVNFDEKTGITYYGKAVPSIRAQYKVTDNNFDDTRILAGIASASSSGTKKTESLYPEWTKPDIKGKTSRKDGLTTAVFLLSVDADSAHEGVYRFEIEGCDKAGNLLVPSSAQEKADSSKDPSFMAAKTQAQGDQKGRFWTQRKAVDVTAPTGTLMVKRDKDSSIYYEMRFGAGGNDPVKYEPFRKESRAYVLIGSEDLSPTAVSCSLRSPDSSMDALYRKDDPAEPEQGKEWSNDNFLEFTVEGEQVFYLESILIMDRAGNVRANDGESSCTLEKSSNIYLDVTAPSVSEIGDMESPKVRISAQGSFTRHEADGERYIYRPDGSALDLKVSVTDPGGRGRSSGLGRVTVEVRVGDRVVTDKVILDGLPYSCKKDSGTEIDALNYEILDARISIPAGSFAESNDITITVRARDNSGNESLPARDGGLLKLGIDTTAPRVEVNYHDTAEPRNGRYFSAGRKAEIIVIDRNVEAGKISIDTNTDVPSAFEAPHANKTADGGGETGNEDRWIKMLSYDADGDYTLQISGTDALGNLITDIVWNGPAPNDFTVDTTGPVVRILLPPAVNERNGVRYYDRAVTAKIEITEHNFRPGTDADAPKVTISAQNHCGAEAPAAPGHTAFVSAGQDCYVSGAEFAQDGDYEITASYTDPAGNRAQVWEAVYAQAPEDNTKRRDREAGGEARSGKFTVDTAAPRLWLDPETFRVDPSTGEPLEGLQNQIYTDRDFAPRLLIRDINCDAEGSSCEVRVSGADALPDEMTVMEGDGSTGDYSIRFGKFEMVREADGVYEVIASAADLAGHETKLEFVFSINRFGSTYVYADDRTREKMEAYYIRDTEEPVRILEVSPLALKAHRVELFKDHERSVLTQGEQYTFGPAESEEKTVRDSRGHSVYEYVIAPEVFAEEGLYDFILSSTDAAGSANSTALFRDGTVGECGILQSKFPIEFQVDKTVPVNRITGLPSGKEQFNADRLDFTVFPEDSQTDIREVEVKITSGSKNGTDPQEVQTHLLYREIAKEEDPGELALKHIYPIEEAGKGIRISLQEMKSWQFLEVITTDLAGNRSIDYRKGDPRISLPETRRRFLVTTDPLVRLGTGTMPVYITAAAVCLLLCILFFLHRHKKRSGRE